MLLSFDIMAGKVNNNIMYFEKYLKNDMEKLEKLISEMIRDAVIAEKNLEEAKSMLETFKAKSLDIKEDQMQIPKEDLESINELIESTTRLVSLWKKFPLMGFKSLFFNLQKEFDIENIRTTKKFFIDLCIILNESLIPITLEKKIDMYDILTKFSNLFLIYIEDEDTDDIKNILKDIEVAKKEILKLGISSSPEDNGEVTKKILNSLLILQGFALIFIKFLSTVEQEYELKVAKSTPKEKKIKWKELQNKSLKVINKLSSIWNLITKILGSVL